MKQLFSYWLPIALCIAGLLVLIGGLVAFSLIDWQWLGRDAVFIAARVMGVGASLIFSGAVSAAIHAAWHAVSNLRQ